MRNYVDMYECATFSPKGSKEDKHLAECGQNMFKFGADKMFPNGATANNTIEAMRILMKSTLRRCQFFPSVTIPVTLQLWDG